MRFAACRSDVTGESCVIEGADVARLHFTRCGPRSSEMDSEPRRVIVGHHDRVLRTIDPVVRASRRPHATARPSGAGASLTCERGR
jgi:hypothetical protein